MEGVVITATVGLVLAAGAFLAGRSRGGSGAGLSVKTFSTIESMRQLGELSVFKVITKEIVTADQHCFGEVGKRFFEWMLSSKKMAMILSFDIDFRYDLRGGDFRIEESGPGAYRLHLPSCFYETHIRDISFYDEQNSKLLPWLLPDILNRAFGGAFSETDKNRLIDEAKKQAAKQAEELVGRMRGEVQQSARQTLEAIAKGFGATSVQFDFGTSKLVQSNVEYDAADAA